MLKICRLISKVSIQLIVLMGNVALAVIELLSELSQVKFKQGAIAGDGVGLVKFLGFKQPGRPIPDRPGSWYRRCNTIVVLTQA